MIKLVETPAAGGLAGWGCGAVVALKSGGTPMTVRELIKGAAVPTVTCDWHTSEGVLFTDKFPVAMLTRSEPLEPDAGGEP